MNINNSLDTLEVYQALGKIMIGYALYKKHIYSVTIANLKTNSILQQAYQFSCENLMTPKILH